jgi:type IV pilus assembly protein PilF
MSTLIAPSRLALMTLIVLSLTACNTAGVKKDEDLGATREHSPGDIYAQMGKEYMRQGQPAVALRKLQRGLEVDPNNSQIHAILGRLYEQLGEDELANRHYARAAYLEPENPYFHNAWGSFLCQQQEYGMADEQFRRALDNPLYDRPWAASTNAGVCSLRAGRVEQAEAYLRQALNANPRIPLALRKMAEISMQRDDFAAAKTYLERYAQVAPHTPDTLLLGVRAERELNNPEGANRYREALERHFPDASETQTARELLRP